MLSRRELAHLLLSSAAAGLRQRYLTERLLASAVVERETPRTFLPFAKPAPFKFTAGKPRVFFHYMPTFPISIDNKFGADDYYNRVYGVPSGESGKYLEGGGYLRERPCPIEPLPLGDWEARNILVEILRAKRIGGDGFAVNIMSLEGPLWERTKKIATLHRDEVGFEFVPVIDCVSLGSREPVDKVAGKIAELFLASTSSRPVGKCLMSAFAAEHWAPKVWSKLIDLLHSDGILVQFIPIILDFPAAAKPYVPISTGMSSWGKRGPLETASSNEMAAWCELKGSCAGWMAPVAAQDFRSTSNSYGESANTGAFRASWTRAISDAVELVQVITWNDYGEGSAVAPACGSSFLWYDLAAYYIAWLKSAYEPNIQKDELYYSYRESLEVQGYTRGETVMHFEGITPYQSRVELIALLEAPATIHIIQGSESVSVRGKSGFNVLTSPASLGRPRFVLERNGVTKAVTGKYTIRERPRHSSSLYKGGSLLRDSRDFSGVCARAPWNN